MDVRNSKSADKMNDLFMIALLVYAIGLGSAMTDV